MSRADRRKIVEPVIEVHVWIKGNFRDGDGVEFIERFCSLFISVDMWIIVTELFTCSLETVQFLHYTEMKKKIESKVVFVYF